MAETRTFPILERNRPTTQTIPWERAERAYRTYSRLYGTQQSLERLAARGGFSMREVACLERGHSPGECPADHGTDDPTTTPTTTPVASPAPRREEEMHEGPPPIRTPIRLDGRCDVCGELVTDVRNHSHTGCYAPPDRIAYVDPRRTQDEDPIDEVVGTGAYHLELLSATAAYLQLGNQHLRVVVTDRGQLEIVRVETLSS